MVFVRSDIFFVRSDNFLSDRTLSDGKNAKCPIVSPPHYCTYLCYSLDEKRELYSLQYLYRTCTVLVQYLLLKSSANFTGTRECLRVSLDSSHLGREGFVVVEFVRVGHRPVVAFGENVLEVRPRHAGQGQLAAALLRVLLEGRRGRARLRRACSHARGNAALVNKIAITRLNFGCLRDSEPLHGTCGQKERREESRKNSAKNAPEIGAARVGFLLPFLRGQKAP